ncbi:MAG: prepilin-type N-terminal cleavage/methylation domain-containing protein, partial [Alphaproteobacteria bacterium]|nr:prepilin-type N-terminal cleavage/methylation domain-containing protein [Alphaproteobacteria bacterium]
MQSVNKVINRSAGDKGFTLLEMAVVVIILGILTVAFAQVYALRVQHVRAQDGIIDVKSVTSAIAAFRSMNGRYPCPASLTATADDPLYGREACPDTDVAPIAVGACGATEGVCIQESDRLVDIDGSGVMVRPRIRIGGVPFRQLNLQEEQSFDGYGNRIKYSVTENLTDDSLFNPTTGGVSILNQTDATAIEPMASGHFIVYSHGKNGFGAHTRDGQFLECDAATTEGRNCNFNCTIDPADGTSTCNVIREARYRISELNTSENNGNFDDVVNYFIEDDIPLWQVSEANFRNIHQKPTGNVGINMGVLDVVGERGYINGTVQIRDDASAPGTGGQGQVDEVCDLMGNDCFPITKISGVPNEADQTAPGSSIVCPPGQFILSISDGVATCGTPEVRCPTGEYMTGVNANGSLQCQVAFQPPASCTTQQFGICNTTAFINPGADGVTNSITGGASRREYYRCNNGTWEFDRATGLCDCTPEVISTRNVSCGTGYTGNAVTTVTRICPAGTQQTNTDRAACVCVARQPQVQNGNCPSGLTPINGGMTRSREWVCAANGTGNWGPWSEYGPTSNCVCNPGQVTSTASCPSGFTGRIDYVQDRICPNGTLSARREVGNTCTCSTRTRERTSSCPEGYQGEIVERQSTTCPSGAWETTWSTVRNTCAPIPPR